MVGETISHYRVLRALGSGGMGEVYEAEDTKLGRHVAIKFLSAARPATAAARQRFEREARAASALNHPHICTVHEFGAHEQQLFIVMELLQGAVLRDCIRQHPPAVEQCLDFAIEIADALDAAHRAGIVHRDITPSNIFITADGHVKVLDFGLAKMQPAGVGTLGDGDAPTRSASVPVTAPGTVMGTTAYMSPEQIAGEELDSRSDVFSFGCVIYEMATGVRPFAGKTMALVFDAILHQVPVPATSRNPAVPAALQQIIDRALEKDRNLRYQNGGEIHRDLQRLRNNLHTSAVRRTSLWARGRTARVVLFVLVVAMAAGIAYVANGRRGDGIPGSTAHQITSSPGVETDPAISPDGSTIAYASREADGNDDIWIVDARGGPPQRFTASAAADRYPVWFPDGGTLAFVSDRGGRDGIWRAPRLDGEAATLLVDDAEEPAISPDGREVAFVRSRGAYMRVAVALIDDPASVRFLTGDRDGKWDHLRPAWSPDGQTICYDAWDGLWLVPAHGGTARRLTSADAHEDSEPVWSSDGRFVYFTSLRGRQLSLWRISREGGAPERVTVGSGIERTPRVSRDGHLLAFSTSPGARDLVLRDLTTGQEMQFGSSRDEMFPAFAPDGRTIYFTSNRWGAFDIWAQDIAGNSPAGAARRIVEAEGVESHLACSADGRWLAYYRILNGHRDVMIVPTSGGRPRRITDDPSDSMDPAWSPDGTRLVLSSERDGTPQLWVQPIEKGKAVGAAMRITSGPGVHRAPAWSPDGWTIAYVFSQGTRSEIAIAAGDGRSPSQLLTAGANAQFVRWIAAGRGLLVKGRWSGTQYELRALNRDGSAQQNFQTAPLGAGADLVQFDVSHDGRLAVFTRGAFEGDIWVLNAGSRQF